MSDIIGVPLGILRLRLDLADVSIPDPLDYFPIPWQTADQDDLGVWNVLSPTEIPVPVAARFFDFSGKIRFAASATGDRYFELFVNGTFPATPYLDFKTGPLSGNATYETNIPGSLIHSPCAGGDILTIIAFQSTAGALNLKSGDDVFAQFIWYG